MHRHHALVFLTIFVSLNGAIRSHAAQAEGVVRLRSKADAPGIARVPRVGRTVAAHTTRSAEGIVRLGGKALRSAAVHRVAASAPQQPNARPVLREPEGVARVGKPPVTAATMKKADPPPKIVADRGHNESNWKLPKVASSTPATKTATAAEQKLPLIRSSRPRSTPASAPPAAYSYSRRTLSHRAPIGRAESAKASAKSVVIAGDQKPTSVLIDGKPDQPATAVKVPTKVASKPVPKTVRPATAALKAVTTNVTRAPVTATVSNSGSGKPNAKQTQPARPAAAKDDQSDTFLPPKIVSTRPTSVSAKTASTPAAGNSGTTADNTRSVNKVTGKTVTSTDAEQSPATSSAPGQSTTPGKGTLTVPAPKLAATPSKTRHLSRPDAVFRPERHWLGLTNPEVHEPVYLQDLESLLQRKKAGTPARTVAQSAPVDPSDCDASDLNSLFRPIDQTVAFAPRAEEMSTPTDCASSLMDGAVIPEHYNSQVLGGPPAPSRHVHAFCHNPLYFEDMNLERCGRGHYCSQTAVSAARFFGTAAIMPYLMTLDHPTDCVQASQDCPTCYEFPAEATRPRWSLKAAAVQAAAVTGYIFIIP